MDTVETFDFSKVTAGCAVIVRLENAQSRPISDVQRIADAILPRIPKGSLLLFLKHGDSLDLLDENQMELKGWIRKTSTTSLRSSE